MKCSFCRKEMKSATGKIYIKKDGKVKYYCSMKCEKNDNKLKRDNKKLKWTRDRK